MAQLKVTMIDGRTIEGRTCLMDQRGYAKFARVNGELPATEDASTFSLFMAFQFYKRMTGDDSLTFDSFCEAAEDLETDEPLGDPTTATT